MNLKTCPLCDALNHEANESCFSCGWAGKMEIEDAEKLSMQAAGRLNERGAPDPDISRMSEIHQFVEKFGPDNDKEFE